MFQTIKSLWNRFPKSMRGWVLLVVPALAVVAMSFGPNGWTEPKVRILYLVWGMLCVSLAHIARKGLHNQEDSRTAWTLALKGNTAAAIVFFALCVLEGVLFLGFIHLAST